jgi:hypothetical protein
MPMLNGDPIRDAKTATSAYLLVIGQPMADLDALTFEPPVVASLPFEQPVERVIALEAAHPDVLAGEPDTEHLLAPNEGKVIQLWDRLSK